MAARAVMMILRTGKQTGANSYRAFTLIELILVMAMLAIVLAVAAPSLANFFHGRSLDSEGRRFIALARYAQSRAVSEGVPIVLWVDAKSGSYGIEQEVSYDNTEDPRAVDLLLDKDLQIRITDLPNQAALSPAAAAVTTGRNAQAIRFGPDGFIADTSPRTIVISQDRGDAIWIIQSRNRLNYEIQTNILQSTLR